MGTTFVGGAVLGSGLSAGCAEANTQLPFLSATYDCAADFGPADGMLHTWPSGDRQESSSNSVIVLSRAREMPFAAVTVPV